jgi:hypothetical protein
MARMEQSSTAVADLLAKAAEYRSMAKTAISARTRDAFFNLAVEYEALAVKRKFGQERPDTMAE